MQFSNFSALEPGTPYHVFGSPLEREKNTFIGCQMDRRVSPVKIVDRVGPVIFHVPAEAREAHAHVRPGYFHAGNIGIDVPQD